MEWSGRALYTGQRGRWTGLRWSTAMSNNCTPIVATMGIDIGKNSFHVIGLDGRGAIVLRQKWSRSQIEARVANMPPCLICGHAIEAHHRYERSRRRAA